jgi:hypothetical protein
MDWAPIDMFLMEILQITLAIGCKIVHSNVNTNITAAMAKQYICNACDALYNKTLTSDNACFLCTACTKFQSVYCYTCNRLFLSGKCYQNHLTVRVKSQLVCECRPVWRNCSLLRLQILSFNVSRHSAISVTISSHQSVFVTSLRSSLTSFHTDLCTFCSIRNAHKILNIVIDISNNTEQYISSANVFKVWSNCELEYVFCTCAKLVHVFWQDHTQKFINYIQQFRKCADKIYVISHNVVINVGM